MNYQGLNCSVFETIYRSLDHISLSAYRDLNLAGLSESLRRAALSYRILDNSLTTPETVVKKAANGFLDSLFNMRDMPIFCKGGLHEIIRPSVQRLLQVSSLILQSSSVR